MKKRFDAIEKIAKSEEAQEFLKGGRADREQDRDQKSASDLKSDRDQKSSVGRPPNQNQSRLMISLHDHDLERLDQLLLRWRKESGSRGGVKITQVLRVLLNTHLEALESLEGVSSEDDLASRLTHNK